jgi:anti-sigma-K factor RskA
VLIPAGTRPAPAGRTWELWFVDDGVPRAAGTFEGASAGPAVLSGSLGTASVVAVTLEPGDGGPKPTTAPVATFPVPSP